MGSGGKSSLPPPRLPGPPIVSHHRFGCVGTTCLSWSPPSCPPSSLWMVFNKSLFTPSCEMGKKAQVPSLTLPCPHSPSVARATPFWVPAVLLWGDTPFYHSSFSPNSTTSGGPPIPLQGGTHKPPVLAPHVSPHSPHSTGRILILAPPVLLVGKTLPIPPPHPSGTSLVLGLVLNPHF